MAISAVSTDGAAHAVQMYSDVSGGPCQFSEARHFFALTNFVAEWNSGDRSQTILWTENPKLDVVFHSVNLQSPEKFTEVINQAEWGTFYYAMLSVSRY